MPIVAHALAQHGPETTKLAIFLGFFAFVFVAFENKRKKKRQLNSVNVERIRKCSMFSIQLEVFAFAEQRTHSVVQR